MKKLLPLIFVASSFVSFSNLPVFSQSTIKTAYCSQKWSEAEKISLQQIKIAKDITTKAQWQEYQKLMNSYKTGKQKPSSEQWRQTCGTPYPFTQTSSKPANNNCEILGKLAANSPDCLDYAKKKGILAENSNLPLPPLVFVAVSAVNEYRDDKCEVELRMLNEYNVYLNSFSLDLIAISESGRIITRDTSIFSDIKPLQIKSSIFTFSTPCFRIKKLKISTGVYGCKLDDTSFSVATRRELTSMNNQVVFCDNFLDVNTVKGKLPLVKELSLTEENIKRELNAR